MIYETPVIIDGERVNGEYYGDWKRDKFHGRGTLESNLTKFIGTWANDKKIEGELICKLLFYP